MSIGLGAVQSQSGFFSERMVPHVISMNLTDALFTQLATQTFHDHDDYVLDSRIFLQMAVTTGVNRGVLGWIQDLFQDGCILPEIASKVLLHDHWVPFMQQLMQKFPARCSLCAPWSMRHAWSGILTELSKREVEGQLFFDWSGNCRPSRSCRGCVFSDRRCANKTCNPY